MKRYHCDKGFYVDHQGAFVRVQDLIEYEKRIDEAIALCEEGICCPDSYSQPCADEFTEDLADMLRNIKRCYHG